MGLLPDHRLRDIDAMASERNWDGLLLAYQAGFDATGSHAVAAARCAYHLALSAPAKLAASVLNYPPAQSTVPLAEVATQEHSWSDLAPFLSGPALFDVAHERVVRGDDLRRVASLANTESDLPLALCPWEPTYAPARYSALNASFPTPTAPSYSPVARLPRPGEAIGDPHVVDAFNDLVSPWTTRNRGRLDVVTSEGDHLNAIACLGGSRARLAEVSFADAMGWMVWAGASGGARGRRRGNAAGRFYAWCCVAALAGVSEDWPIDPAELGEIGQGLHWYLWDVDDASADWKLRLAVYDDVEELGLAISAIDRL